MAAPKSDSGRARRAGDDNAGRSSFDRHLESAAAESPRANGEPSSEPRQPSADAAAPPGRSESPPGGSAPPLDQASAATGDSTATQGNLTSTDPAHADGSSAEHAAERPADDRATTAEPAVRGKKKSPHAAAVADGTAVDALLPALAVTAPVVQRDAATLAVVLDHQVQVKVGLDATLPESARAGDRPLAAAVEPTALDLPSSPEAALAGDGARAVEAAPLQRPEVRNLGRTTKNRAEQKLPTKAPSSVQAAVPTVEQPSNADEPSPTAKVRHGSRQEVLARAAASTNVADRPTESSPTDQTQHGNDAVAANPTTSSDRWSNSWSPRLSRRPRETASADAAGSPGAVEPAETATEPTPTSHATNRSVASGTAGDWHPATGAPAADGDALTSADRARLVQRVARAFQSIGPSGGTMRLRLSPPELGQVKLEVSLRAGVLSARLEAETQETRRLLADHLPELRQRLAAHHVRIESVEVDVQTQSQGGFPQQAGDRGQDAARQPAAAPRTKVRTAPAAEPVPPVGLARRGDPARLNIVV